jgi:queuine tRNA-ribosyltransferase
VCNVDLPGYAIGGVAVGESPEKIAEVVKFTANLLPEEKPRYLMGVGYERDLVAAVAAGMDMFDCVLPTRNARNAHAFTRKGPLNLRNARFADDAGVIQEGCSCATCTDGNSRAYLRHLFSCKEMLGGILLSIHNIHHFQSLMIDIRLAIEDNSWSALPNRWPVLTKNSI